VGGKLQPVPKNDWSIVAISVIFFYPPIKTVGQPAIMVPPCAVTSFIRAAGLPPIITVAEPITMLSGGPAQVHILPTVAAGCPPIKTVGTPGGKIGPPTCGLPFGFTSGHTWLSVIRAAGGIFFFFESQESRVKSQDRKGALDQAFRLTYSFTFLDSRLYFSSLGP